MRVFVTGATGFIGSAVVDELVESGHEVVGLARSDAAAASLLAVGAQPHRGSLEDLESLRIGAANAEGVIHLAFFHGISKPRLATRVKIIAGGSPRMIVTRFAAAAGGADGGAIKVIGEVLAGSDRPFVTASATLAAVEGIGATLAGSEPPPVAGSGSMKVASRRRAVETDPTDSTSPRRSETVLGLADRGVRASTVRLAPTVHGEGDQAFLHTLIKTARKKGFSGYVADGENRWPAVHRLDAARLFRMALEDAPAGTVLHAVADETIPFREIAEAIGHELSLPAQSVPLTQAGKHFGFLGPVVVADNPASSRLTRERFGWQPAQLGLIADIEQGHYFGHALINHA